MNLNNLQSVAPEFCRIQCCYRLPTNFDCGEKETDLCIVKFEGTFPEILY